MHTIPYTQIPSEFPALLLEMKEGEKIVITMDEKPVAELAALPQEHPAWDKRGGFGSAKGLFTMSDDFDEPLEDFAEYM